MATSRLFALILKKKQSFVTIIRVKILLPLRVLTKTTACQNLNTIEVCKRGLSEQSY